MNTMLEEWCGAVTPLAFPGDGDRARTGSGKRLLGSAPIRMNIADFAITEFD